MLLLFKQNFFSDTAFIMALQEEENKILLPYSIKYKGLTPILSLTKNNFFVALSHSANAKIPSNRSNMLMPHF